MKELRSIWKERVEATLSFQMLLRFERDELCRLGTRLRVICVPKFLLDLRRASMRDPLS